MMRDDCRFLPVQIRRAGKFRGVIEAHVSGRGEPQYCVRWPSGLAEWIPESKLDTRFTRKGV